MRDMLHERDWSFISETIYQMNFEENLQRAGRIALDALYVLIPCDQVMLTLFEDGDKGPNIHCGYIDYVGVEARYLDLFRSGKYDDDPYFRYCNLLRETKCFRDSDTMSDEYRESTAIFKDIYAKQGIYYGIRSYLVYKGKVVANVSAFSSKERGDFSQRDLFVLDTIAPHIALRIGRSLAETESSEIAEKRLEGFSKLGLTAREQEIASKVVDGLSDSDIAESLCISRSTLKKHIYNIYQKLDVNNRVQLYAALSQL